MLALITCAAISVLTFVIIRLPPGDFVDAYIANLAVGGSTVSAEQAAAMRREYGLDRPVVVQYGLWMGTVVAGDFGVSMMWTPSGHRSDRRPAVAHHGGVAWPRSSAHLGDRAADRHLFGGAAIFDRRLRLHHAGLHRPCDPELPAGADPDVFRLPLSGPERRRPVLAGICAGALELGEILGPDGPSAAAGLVLALAGTAQLIRIMRANLLDELRKPYVVTARAKGLSEPRVIMKYPVRAALNPFASTIAYLFPYLVSGSIVISLVLGLPTVGPLLLQSLVAQDMFLAGTIVLLLGVLTVIGTLISDLLLMWIDPRIRLQGRA